MSYMMTFLNPKLMTGNKMIKLLILMMICNKGLMFEELHGLTKISTREWKIFLNIF